MKRFILAATALSLSLAGCDNERYGDPTLGDITSISVVPGMSYSIPVSGGSGEYTVELRDSGAPVAFADVSIERRARGHILVVETREGEKGSALIVVTDKQSGKTVECILDATSGVLNGGWKITGQQDYVDAFPDSEIIDDLQNTSFPEGTFLFFDPHVEHPGRHGAGHWYSVNTDEHGVPADTLAAGTFVSMPLDLRELPAAYDKLPVERQIHHAIRYIFEQEDGRHIYDLFFVSASENYDGKQNRLFYEDRTAHYQAKYPDTKVTTVVNRYVSHFGYQ